MRSRTLLGAIALLSAGTLLGGCVTSDGPPPVNPGAPSYRVTLPPAPQGLRECFAKNFPEIADADLSEGQVAMLIGKAKLQDRAKSRCGMRAIMWIEAVREGFAR